MIKLPKFIKIIIFIFLLYLSFLNSPFFVFAPTLRPFAYIQDKQICFPQHAATTGKAIWLKYKLNQYVKHPAYQKQHGITFCNVWARDVFIDQKKDKEKYCFFFSDFHYNVSSVFPRINHIYMNIPKAYQRAMKALKQKLIISWTAEQAQERANIGKLIWGISRKFNHEFLICPGKWNDKTGCVVAQAGEVNGIFRISDREVFGKNWKDEDIKFYEFPEKIKIVK